MLRILNFGTVFSAKLLSQLDCACRAELYASSSGYALLFVHVGHVGGSGHVRRIEEL